MSIIKIGTSPKYRIYLATGTIYLQEFHVDAVNEMEALNIVADYCEEHLVGLCADHYELFDLCEGETVDEYAEANNLTCCGNHGVYIEVAGMEEL